MPQLKYLLVLSLLLSLGFPLSAQLRKAALQRQNQALQKEIRALTQQITLTRHKSHSSLSVIQDLSRKLDLRARLIRNIHQEVTVLEKQIQNDQQRVDHLNRDLKYLKSRYAAFIRKSYESRSREAKLMFLLASDSFLQAYNRLSYMRQYAAYRKEQGETILATRNRIVHTLSAIKGRKAETQALLRQKERERRKWQTESAEQKKLLGQLQSKARELLAEVEHKQKQKRQLDRQIQRIIQREIRLARARAKRAREARKRAEAKRVKKSSYAPLPRTAEAKALSAHFTANKNRLPWPVVRGRLISKFGRQAYPGLEGIYVENSGVEIATSRGATARAVFKGTVSSLYAVPGGSQAVLIRHGDYYTLYNNLDQIFVKRGEPVETKQKIGHIYTNPQTHQTVLEFQIWKKTQKLDPQSWIYKM